MVEKTIGGMLLGRGISDKTIATNKKNCMIVFRLSDKNNKIVS